MTLTYSGTASARITVVPTLTLKVYNVFPVSLSVNGWTVIEGPMPQEDCYGRVRDVIYIQLLRYQAI